MGFCRAPVVPSGLIPGQARFFCRYWEIFNYFFQIFRSYGAHFPTEMHRTGVRMDALSSSTGLHVSI